jgi:hypothetical protein
MIQIHDRAFPARSIALRPSGPVCCAWCLAAWIAYPQRLHIWAITLESGVKHAGLSTVLLPTFPWTCRAIKLKAGRRELEGRKSKPRGVSAKDGVE